MSTVWVVAGCGSAGTSASAEDAGNNIESADGASSGSGGGGGSGSGSGGSSSSSGGSSSGGTSDGGHHADGGGSGGGSGGSSSGGGTDGGSGSGGSAITCPGPGSPKQNGSSCGSERWDIKTGTDSYASSVSLVPQSTTIATLVALAAAGGGTSRESPTETSLWELKDVSLTMIKVESDSDYHIVVSDGPNTMIAEVPSPSCSTSSVWSCFVSRARSEIDSKLSVSSSPQSTALTVTLRGVGFFDHLHGQTGVAPNAIELHPVLQICFGQGCTPS